MIIARYAIFSILALISFSFSTAYCQSSYKLVKKDGHYYTTATINGNADIPVFVETGYPGITLSVDRYNDILASLPFEEIKREQPEWLRTDRAEYKIVKELKGRVPVGDLTYDGFIYVVEPYDNIVTIPVNLLKNENDTTVCLIRFDFKKNTLDYIRREDANLEKMHTYTLVKFNPMPLFESTMDLSDASGHNLKIAGNFNFDLGNGSSLYFFRKTMLPALKENSFKIQTARDNAGKIVGQGIFAAYCKIGDKSKTSFSIGITNNVFFKGNRLGCVGPSFFQNGIVILDPNNNLIYYK